MTRLEAIRKIKAMNFSAIETLVIIDILLELDEDTFNLGYEKGFNEGYNDAFNRLTP